MCRPYVALVFAIGSFLMVATPTAGQLWFFPDYALPSLGGGAVEPWIAGTYGRGLNDASGETNALGLLAGVATPRVAAAGGVARTLGHGDSTIEAWVMPRFTLVGTSEATGTTTEWGTSAGVWLSNSRGVGLHAAFDGRFPEGATQWRLGLGFHWTGTGIADALRMQ